MNNKFLDFFSLKWIRNRLGLAQGIIVMVTALLMGLLTYQQTWQLLARNNINAHRDILNSTEKILEEKESQCRNFMRMILREKQVRQILNAENGIDGSAFTIGERSQVLLNETFSNYLYGVFRAETIYIYDLQGDFYYTGAAEEALLEDAYDISRFKQEEWYRQALEQNGYEIFFGYDVLTGAQDTFSGIKQLRDIETQEPIGLLIVEFNKEILRDVFPDYENRGVYALLESDRENWHQIYPVGQAVLADWSLAEASDEDKSGNYYLVRGDVHSHWTPVYIEKKDAVRSEIIGIRKIVVSVTAVCLLAGLIAMTWISFRMLSPLSRLKDLIISVGGGQRQINENFGNDEIGLIGQEFQKTVNDRIALSEAVLQEQIAAQRAELELMQSNINPHFLYNTLDSLYWMAIDKEVDDIAEVVQALSSIFRTALSQGEKEITVEKEVEFIRNYLYIQNIRFDHKIGVDISVDPELRQKKIIKMLLQPFVENAVYHGLEPKIGMGTIAVSAVSSGEGITFQVADDGVGMKSLAEIEKGYAIRNVIERVKLNYGEKASVKFDSEIGKGTCATIFLPYPGDENDQSGTD